MVKRTRYTPAALVLVVLTLLSCTAIFGIPDYDENPCTTGELTTLECGIGACHVFISACSNGLPSTCTPPTTDAEETPDGIDNNCDGLVDEGIMCNVGATQSCYNGSPLTRGVGLCHDGAQECKNGLWSDCLGDVLPQLEICDGKDNDCDSVVDNGCHCTAGQTQECYGSDDSTLGPFDYGPPPCRRGTQSCENGVWGDCKKDVLPGPETCNGIDDNCDGLIDNSSFCECEGSEFEPCYEGPPMTEGIGVCKAGVKTCENGHWSMCENQVVPAPNETCNGLDDDCNGTTDDGDLGANLPCVTTLPGVCASGITQCNTNGLECIPIQGNQPETCNGEDDNCDGEFDNGMFCCGPDGVKNGNESDIDCGGSCTTLCPPGKTCNLDVDCSSGVCVNGKCQQPQCNDTVLNGSETDTDCGGPDCMPCSDGEKCQDNSDCTSVKCLSGLCQPPNCNDGVKNGLETDSDCGGPICPKCGNLASCQTGIDCTSGSCVNKICQPPGCGDGIQNGSETDVDCGGGQCAPCPPPKKCLTGNDCQYGVCSGGTCQPPTCNDGVPNGQETDVDCGGTCPNKCDDGQKCLIGNDCKSLICNGTICQAATCQDGIKNGQETAIDCGGPVCAKRCDPGQGCLIDTDCTSNKCSGAICQAPTCMDGVKNGQETGKDCGGTCPTKCPDGEGCIAGGDCANGICTNSVCQPASCGDNTKNGMETDVDCGGPVCQKCDINKNCTANSDCKTDICTGMKCSPKPNGLPCSTAAECQSNYCVDGVCCNDPCVTLCQACSAVKKGSGVDGICGPIQAGSDPDNDCMTEPMSTCGKTGSCNGSGVCELYSSNIECAAASCLNATTAVTASNCNGLGTCIPGMQISCTPFACSVDACLVNCSIDSHCAPGHYCNGMACDPKKADGSSCSGGNECISGNCVDGVCCFSACTATCRACNVAGSEGTCANLPSGQDDNFPVNACAGSAKSCDGMGVCKKENGQTCAMPSECLSGNCVDGYCCNTTCTGLCTSCNIAGSLGTCTNVPSGQDDTGCTGMAQSCDGFGSCKNENGQTCNVASECLSGNCVDGVCCNTTCLTTCLACDVMGSVGTCSPVPANQEDSGCTAPKFCDGTGICKSDIGEICSVPGDCLSGYCVDGVCCNSSCNAVCMACSTIKKGGGAEGICGSVPAGSDPDNECTMEAPSTCKKTGDCDGAGACQKWPSNTECVPSSCVDTMNVNNPDTCDGNGTCVDNGTMSCAPGQCQNDVCDSSCMVDTECAPNAYCMSMSTCSFKKADGLGCGGANECTSGFCVDGVCCDTLCGGLCQACTMAKKGSGTDGVCGNVGDGSDPDLECPPASCADTVTLNKPNVCDGIGACRMDGTQPCDPYTCSGNACLASCSSDAECAPGNYCDLMNSICVPKLGLGAACSSANQCASTFCAPDGVCCLSDCTAACKTCNASGNCVNVPAGQDDDKPMGACVGTDSCDGSGACKKENGQLCSPGDCLSGNCIDGYCCNSTCTTQCMGCDVSGNLGTCSPLPLYTDDTNATTQCTGNNTCDGSGGCKFKNGQTCSNGMGCASGQCVNEGTKVCCDTACSGLCESCFAAKKGSGSDGACGPIANGTDPDSECAADAVSTCGQDGFCNGAGACRLYASGTVCGIETCLNAIHNLADTCDGIGICVDNGTMACDPFTCQGTSCGSICTMDTECTSGNYCSMSLCVAKKGTGAMCAGDNECLNGMCVMGLCN